jgi:hypothetical protein
VPAEQLSRGQQKWLLSNSYSGLGLSDSHGQRQPRRRGHRRRTPTAAHLQSLAGRSASQSGNYAICVFVDRVRKRLGFCNETPCSRDAQAHGVIDKMVANQEGHCRRAIRGEVSRRTSRDCSRSLEASGGPTPERSSSNASAAGCSWPSELTVGCVGWLRHSRSRVHHPHLRRSSPPVALTIRPSRCP